jgi:hypothetical protein
MRLDLLLLVTSRTRSINSWSQILNLESLIVHRDDVWLPGRWADESGMWAAQSTAILIASGAVGGRIA